MTASLAFENIAFAHEGRAVLHDFSLSIAPGEIVALMGPSGAGKTTVLRLALGLESPARGVVRIDGAIASDGGRVRISAEERRLGVVFQDLALWPHLTVAGNLEFGLAARGVARTERAHRIAAMLERVAMRGKENARPGQLSGGERQRVAIARALVLEPRVIVLDEPLSNLDVRLRQDLIDTFKGLLRERQVTTLYVTHAVGEAATLADRIAVLEGGRVLQLGTSAELRAAPASEFVRALWIQHGSSPVVVPIVRAAR